MRTIEDLIKEKEEKALSNFRCVYIKHYPSYSKSICLNRKIIDPITKVGGFTEVKEDCNGCPFYKRSSEDNI